MDFMQRVVRNINQYGAEITLTQPDWRLVVKPQSNCVKRIFDLQADYSVKETIHVKLDGFSTVVLDFKMSAIKVSNGLVITLPFGCIQLKQPIKLTYCAADIVRLLQRHGGTLTNSQQAVNDFMLTRLDKCMCFEVQGQDSITAKNNSIAYTIALGKLEQLSHKRLKFKVPFGVLTINCDADEWIA